MAEYKLPAEPDGPVWDKNGDKWVRVKENLWYGGFHVYWGWGDVVHYYGPLTTTPPTPPIKVGDTGLTAEQVWDLPKGTVIWPERAEESEPYQLDIWADQFDRGIAAHDAELREQIAQEILDERPPATTEPSLREYITGLRTGHVMAAVIARGQEQD